MGGETLYTLESDQTYLVPTYLVLPSDPRHTNKEEPALSSTMESASPTPTEPQGSRDRRRVGQLVLGQIGRDQPAAPRRDDGEVKRNPMGSSRTLSGSVRLDPPGACLSNTSQYLRFGRTGQGITGNLAQAVCFPVALWQGNSASSRSMTSSLTEKLNH